MPFMLQSSEGDLVHIRALGRITSSQSTGDQGPLPSLTGPAGYAGKALISLEQVDFIDSAGIGWLLASHKRFKQGGGILVIYSVPEQIMLTLKLLRLTSILNIAEDEMAALAMADAHTPR